jgi:hypothetical protein
MNNVILTGAIEVQEQASRVQLGRRFVHSSIERYKILEKCEFGQNYWLVVGILTLSRLEHLIKSFLARHLAPRYGAPGQAVNQVPLHESIQKSATIAVANMEGLFFNVNGGYV